MDLRRNSPSSNGFTLIEVLLAATMLLVGIVGMMHAVASGAETLDLSRKQTIATQVIHGEIEKVRTLDWAQVSALPATETVDLGSDLSTSTFSASTGFRSIARNFQCRRDILPVYKNDGVTAKADQKQVTFTVSWLSGTGRSHTRHSSTFVGKNGLYVAYQR